jgi:hypothetical protein
VDKQSVIHPTPSQPSTPPTRRRCRSATSRLPRYATSTAHTADASTLRRVENGEAFSTRHFQATSLVPLLFFYVSTQAV